MPRRIKPKREVRDWRWYASFILNAAVAVSMVLGTIFLFGGVSAPPAAVPTILPPTESAGSSVPAVPPGSPSGIAPTQTPASQPGTPIPPSETPTPKASAGNPTAISSGLTNVVVVGIPATTMPFA